MMLTDEDIDALWPEITLPQKVARREILRKGIERCFEAGFDRGWQAAIASREPMPADKIVDVLALAISNLKAHSRLSSWKLSDEERYEFQLVRAIERFHGIGE